MKVKNYLWNIFTQIRMYSLVDLMIFLVLLGANRIEFVGVIFLHISFLFYLEVVHKHSYRVYTPNIVWIILCILGIIFYNHIAVSGFLVFSYLYTKKNLSSLGYYAPIFRGLQFYFLSSGIVGFFHPLSFISLVLITIRNFIGDLRDVSKDIKEGLKTLPIALGFKNGIKNLHLIALLLTTLLWWYSIGLSVIWLLMLYVIEIYTYNLTSR